MNRKEFEAIMREQCGLCEKLMLRKSDEYTEGSEDKLIAFRRAAALLGTTPQDALIGMLTKHLVSVADMCKSGKDYPAEQWDEKITDTINYMLLLRAIVTEAQPAPPDPDPEPEPEKKAEKKAEPEKKKPAGKRKRKPIDAGKIGALWKAGWSVAKIADEMRISEPTVRTYLKKMGAK